MEWLFKLTVKWTFLGLSPDGNYLLNKLNVSIGKKGLNKQQTAKK
jgi:hypothetical protein